MKDKIIALHGEKTLRISAARSAAGPEVFRHMLEGKGYRTVLEIGTYRGCAAAEMSQYCEKVITIDLKFGSIEKRRGTFDRVAFWRSLGVDNIALCLVENDADKAALVRGLDFDFAFIDGAHDIESVRSDFELVRRCGRVLFHDYSDDVNCTNGVFAFLSTFTQDQIEPMDGFALWTAA